MPPLKWQLRVGSRRSMHREGGGFESVIAGEIPPEYAATLDMPAQVMSVGLLSFFAGWVLRLLISTLR